MANKNIVRPALEKYMHLSNQEWGTIHEYVEYSTFKKGDRITDIGVQEQYIYWIEKGLLRKYYYNGKHEITTEIAKEGNVISSFISFFKEQPSDCIVQAIEPSSLFSLTKQNIERLCVKYPKFHKLYILLITEAFVRSEQRTLEKLKYTSKEIFMRLFDQDKDLIMRVPQKVLSSYLGVRQETFSRYKRLSMRKTGEKLMV